MWHDHRPSVQKHRKEKAKSHEERLAAFRKRRTDQHNELRQAGKTLRRDVLRGGAEKKFAKLPTEPQCRRCGISKDELAPFDRGLEKHHVIAIADGGHPSDPSNLLTLCYFCHREWHTWWEGYHEWPGFMAATPYRLGVMGAHARESAIPPSGCRRCGISEARCTELHPRRAALAPFQLTRQQRDASVPVCYWCQREWEVFWQCIRADVHAFHAARPFKPTE